MENSLYIYSILPEPSTPFLVKVFFSLPLKPTLKERKNSSKGLPLKNWKQKWEKHPVLHLDLNAEKYDSPERLYDILSRQLTLWETNMAKE